MKARKKRKFRKLYWLLIGLAVVIGVIVLLLYKPSRYNPAAPIPAGEGQEQVSPYLTHELLTQLYNGTQRQEPFDLVVTQEGINDIVRRFKWPVESDGVSFSAPEVLFVKDRIVLMGTAVVGGVEFVITIVTEPRLNAAGLLNLHVGKVKVGILNITLLARVMARRMYAKTVGTTKLGTENLEAKIAASLLNNEPFEPVFDVEDKKVRLEKVTITQEKLTARLIPASDQTPYADER